MVLQRNEWNGIVTIEVAEGGKAAAGATAVQDLAECRPFFWTAVALAATLATVDGRK